MSREFVTLGFGRSCIKCETYGLRLTRLLECMEDCCTQALCGTLHRATSRGRLICIPTKVLFQTNLTHLSIIFSDLTASWHCKHFSIVVIMGTPYWKSAKCPHSLLC